MLNAILLRRKHKILKFKSTSLTCENYKYVVAIMKNIESLGFTFSKEVVEELAGLSIEELQNFNADLIIALEKMTGADKKYEAFYSTFPDLSQYSDWDLLINALVHYWSEGTLVIAEELKPRMPLVEDVTLTILELGTIDDLIELRNNLIESKTALSHQDKDDLVWILKNVSCYNLPEVIPFKENVCLIANFIKENTADNDWLILLHPYFKTATDVLRFAIQMSNGDTSLAVHTRFKKFNRKERRLILGLLENCKNIEEDMLRYKTTWIRLGEIIHPGEYDDKYPKAFVAFRKLRDDIKIETFWSKVAAAMQREDIDAVLKLLSTRPGELARRLDYLMRSYDIDKILKCFDTVADKVSIPVLLAVKEAFTYRNCARDMYVYFPKGQLAKAYAKEVDPEKEVLFTDETCQRVITICEKAIKMQLLEKNTEPWGKIYIADSMKGFVMPQNNNRSASSGMKIITRCSRIPLEKNFVRFFIKWENELINGYEERTDIDLSCSFLDSDYQHIETVDWMRIRTDDRYTPYAVHSGDFINAPRPHGAAEYLDLDIEKAKEHGVRYAVAQVYGYTRTPFCKLDSLYMGWMERNEPEMGEIFEPATVKNKINLTGNTMCSLPLVIDLHTKEIIWLDLAVSTHVYFHRCAAANINSIALTVKGLLESHKPQMYDVLQLNAAVTGTITEDRNQADIIFDTCTDKPYEEILIEKERIGDKVICEIERKIREDVKIITPYDLDFFMAQCI